MLYIQYEWHWPIITGVMDHKDSPAIQHSLHTNKRLDTFCSSTSWISNNGDWWAYSISLLLVEQLQEMSTYH
jgi:hypothetical protein